MKRNFSRTHHYLLLLKHVCTECKQFYLSADRISYVEQLGPVEQLPSGPRSNSGQTRPETLWLVDRGSMGNTCCPTRNVRNLKQEDIIVKRFSFVFISVDCNTTASISRYLKGRPLKLIHSHVD